MGVIVLDGKTRSHLTRTTWRTSIPTGRCHEQPSEKRQVCAMVRSAPSRGSRPRCEARPVFPRHAVPCRALGSGAAARGTDRPCTPLPLRFGGGRRPDPLRPDEG
jgi:hypothetical protein